MINSPMCEEIHPVELVVPVHCKFLCIHPFWDSNGRILLILFFRDIIFQ
ncbi:MAG: Fic family protein [Candidatus Heimdallarchaeota archaeon]|nr:Fic family protein [Candidatus Heimdallarchaeota archaeon]